MIPWAKVLKSELAAARAAKLTGREYGVWLAAKMLGHNGWTINCRALEHETGLSRRHLLLVLSSLETKGLVRRKYRGSRKDPWGRFVIEASIEDDRSRSIVGDPSRSIGADRSSPPSLDRGRSISTFQASDHRSSDQVIPRSDHVRSFDQGVQGERTNERVDRLVQTARELWPEMARSAARRFVERLAEIAAGVSVDELAHFMRSASSDPSVARADIPLAVVCTRDRWEEWARRRRRAASTSGGSKTDPPSGVRLTPSEIAELATAAALK